MAHMKIVERYRTGGKIVKFDLCVIRLIANIESATGKGGAKRGIFTWQLAM